jgi:uncharacterized paraquat-inducible protein A
MIRLYGRNIDAPELFGSDPAIIARLAAMFEQQRHGKNRLATAQAVQLGSLAFVAVLCWLFWLWVDLPLVRGLFIMAATVAWVMVMGSYGNRVAKRVADDFVRFVSEQCPAGIPLFCLKCDYDLRGSTSGMCPECGEPVRQWENRPVGAMAVKIKMLGRDFEIPELAGMPSELGAKLIKRFEDQGEGRNRLAITQGAQLLSFVLLLVIAFAIGQWARESMAVVLIVALAGVWMVAAGLFGNAAMKAIGRDFSRFIRQQCPDGKPRYCLRCDYDLRGAEGAACPQCGAAAPTVKNGANPPTGVGGL